MRDTNLCTFCNSAKESYTHLFVMCTFVKIIWPDIEIFMNKFNTDKINFNIANILLNQLILNRPGNIKNIKECKNYTCWLVFGRFEKIQPSPTTRSTSNSTVLFYRLKPVPECVLVYGKDFSFQRFLLWQHQDINI